jgi:hypothetical protein
MTRQTEQPDALVDTYGSKPPRAAEFGKGISDRACAQEAQDARRNATAGGYGERDSSCSKPGKEPYLSGRALSGCQSVGSAQQANLEPLRES